MKAWIIQRGRLLGWVAMSAVIAAVVAPVIALLIGIPYLSGTVPYPQVNPMQVALVVSGVLAAVAMASGIAVWAVHAPGNELGIASVVVLGTILLMIGLMLVMIANPEPLTDPEAVPSSAAATFLASSHT